MCKHGQWVVQCHFKITDFSTDQKPVCHLLLVKLNDVSHCFPVIVAYWSNYCFWHGCLYITPSFGVNPWILHCKIWPQSTRNITELCGVNHQYERQTDGWTDRQNYDSSIVHLMTCAKTIIKPYLCIYVTLFHITSM